ncbi:hypothetical protein CRENBAI_021843 [Crenichthys baileyi]|uniref:Uncharacterized protein n=1 Tax=Crenichthys baileyi TaxID=28760 RepID=A0AAV9RI47_9TELE
MTHRLTDRELCCQGLNSSCKRPAAPRHAPLLPRWLRDIPAALRRSAHEESVMEWLCEPPGSISRCTAATLLLLQPCGLNAQIRDRILLPPLPVYEWERAQMVVSSEKPSMQLGLGLDGGTWREHTLSLAQDGIDIPQEMIRKSWTIVPNCWDKMCLFTQRGIFDKWLFCQIIVKPTGDMLG